MPFSIHDSVDHPISLYAATKKANELMAHSYSHLYGLPTTGLRFFTVYGPWGRPDMAMFIFAKAIAEGRPIKLFNYGRARRDFTYIDDVIEAVERIIDIVPAKSETPPRDAQVGVRSSRIRSSLETPKSDTLWRRPRPGHQHRAMAGLKAVIGNNRTVEISRASSSFLELEFWPQSDHGTRADAARRRAGKLRRRRRSRHPRTSVSGRQPRSWKQA